MVADTFFNPKNTNSLLTPVVGTRCGRQKRPSYWLLSILVLAMSARSEAGSLMGTVVGDSGQPLYKVPMCLRLSGEDRKCSKIQSTDREGRYRFNGLKDGNVAHVAVFQDETAAGRKFDRYRTYVWSPAGQTAVSGDRKSSVNLTPFVGEFNFSNYQRSLKLTANDFPELRALDLEGDYVMLKVFLASPIPEAPPETIFLGRVLNADLLSVAASVPLSATAINYQIYSASLSIEGSVSLTGDR